MHFNYSFFFYSYYFPGHFGVFLINKSNLMKTPLCFKAIFLFALFCFSNKIISAQSNQYPVLAMSVQVTAISSDTSLGGLPALTDTTVFSANMSIDLFDTTGIDQIEVKLGSVMGGSDYLSKNFLFDVPGSFGDGTSFYRNDFNVSIGLGHYPGLTDYFAEIRIKRQDGSFTDSVLFNR